MCGPLADAGLVDRQAPEPHPTADGDCPRAQPTDKFIRRLIEPKSPELLQRVARESDETEPLGHGSMNRDGETAID